MAERREALKIIGAIGVTCAFPYSADELYGQHVHPTNGKQAAPDGPKFFTDEQRAVVSRLADLIIPATSTPGALQAGVPAYVEAVVARNPIHQPVFRDGISALDQQAERAHGKKFLSLSEPQQIELLTPLCKAADTQKATEPAEIFFAAVKAITADGYYTSRIGMVDELGFHGGSVLAEFPSCELPEH